MLLVIFPILFTLILEGCGICGIHIHTIRGLEGNTWGSSIVRSQWPSLGIRSQTSVQGVNKHSGNIVR